jgi:hypothetical protein
MTGHPHARAAGLASGAGSAAAAPGPIAGAAVWRQVIAAAGGRCECAGACGGRHRDGNGRCVHEDAPGSPLHAVARDQAARGTAEIRLGAADLMAVCDGCHGGLLARHREAGRWARAEAPGGQERLW